MNNKLPKSWDFCLFSPVFFGPLDVIPNSDFCLGHWKYDLARPTVNTLKKTVRVPITKPHISKNNIKCVWRKLHVVGESCIAVIMLRLFPKSGVALTCGRVPFQQTDTSLNLKSSFLCIFPCWPCTSQQYYSQPPSIALTNDKMHINKKEHTSIQSQADSQKFLDALLCNPLRNSVLQDQRGSTRCSSSVWQSYWSK